MNSPFSQHWLRCQEAQFQQAARTGDNVEGLRTLMVSLGYTSEQLQTLFVQATMHVDDLPDDRLPTVEEAQSMMEAHHVNCACPQCKPAAPKPLPRPKRA